MGLTRRVGRVLAWLLLAVVGFVAMVNLHEVAHTAAARLAGDRTAVYYLYRHQPGGDCFGCNVYDDRRLGYAGNLGVTVAGVIATQLAALALLAAARRRRGANTRTALRVLAGVCLLDLPLQVAQALAADVAHQQRLTRVDLADTLYLLSTRLSVSTGVLEAILVVLGVAVLVAALRLLRTARTSTSDGLPSGEAATA